jgi:hypothetical protein
MDFPRKGFMFQGCLEIPRLTGTTETLRPKAGETKNPPLNTPLPPVELKIYTANRKEPARGEASITSPSFPQTVKWKRQGWSQRREKEG